MKLNRPGHGRALTALTGALALTLLAWAGAGLGAAPKPGGKYEGKIEGGTTSIEKRVSLIVMKDGKHARVLWACGTGRGNTSMSFVIKNGRFKVVNKTGSLVVWTFTGRFVSADEARAELDLRATCDGKGGLFVLNRVTTVADQLEAAKAATAKYQSVAKAEADGYHTVPGADGKPVCFSSPDGGMGIHYENQALMADRVLDIRRPEELVYARGAGGKLKLVAVEYFRADADGNPSTTQDRPLLFGKPFDGPTAGQHPGMATHYELHAWVWQANPKGNFFPWNPSVKCA